MEPRGIGVRLLALAIGCGLAGCETAPPDDRQDAIAAQTALVGMSKVDLLSCAGPPDSSAGQGDLEVLSYSAERLVRGRSGPRTSFGFGSTGSRVILPLGNGNAATKVTSCRARFTLRGGRVETLTYVHGTLGAERLSDCGPLVRPCLKMIEDDTLLQAPWADETGPVEEWNADRKRGGTVGSAPRPESPFDRDWDGDDWDNDDW